MAKMMKTGNVRVIGGGLAGSEAAWQAARLGVHVTLFEMRPRITTPAHTTGDLAELVCSNSLRSNETRTAPGLLKGELRGLGSLLIRVADSVKVPAGGALAVSRQEFAREVTASVETADAIDLVREECKSITENDVVVLATGPLTSPAMEKALGGLIGDAFMHFYDAVAPIVTADSIDMSRCFRASRYEKGEGADYLNCPLNPDQYRAFRQAMLDADLVPIKNFEEPRFFERCLPIEVLAERGEDTMRFGPLKPVGLSDPSTGKRPYAVVQLRQDDFAASHFNMVGFQTRMRWPEQKRIFQLIPALERARFARYGQIHRNTFIEAPSLLEPTTQLKENRHIFVAGQLSGVEGYIESMASGLVAGINAARLALGLEPVTPSPETLTGALLHAITGAGRKSFQPVKISFGILPGLDRAIRNRAMRRKALALRSLEEIERFAHAYLSD